TRGQDLIDPLIHRTDAEDFNSIAHESMPGSVTLTRVYNSGFRRLTPVAEQEIEIAPLVGLQHALLVQLGVATLRHLTMRRLRCPNFQAALQLGIIDQQFQPAR